MLEPINGAKWLAQRFQCYAYRSSQWTPRGFLIFLRLIPHCAIRFAAWPADPRTGIDLDLIVAKCLNRIRTRTGAIIRTNRKGDGDTDAALKKLHHFWRGLVFRTRQVRAVTIPEVRGKHHFHFFAINLALKIKCKIENLLVKSSCFLSKEIFLNQNPQIAHSKLTVESQFTDK